ncbi:MAG: glycosyltransferase family 4 protein [Planctomycetota bacterium]|jgi:glycosyltransferase involved in cell wall biosynthesis
MKVLMLGWEFPPYISGGLGTACYGLTKAMDQLGVQVTFILPKPIEESYTTHVKLLTPESICEEDIEFFREWKNIKFRTISSPLKPYTTPEIYNRRFLERLRKKGRTQIPVPEEFHLEVMDYSGDMYSEVHRYAAMATRLALDEDFDVVHAHDWMTYPAGIAISQMSGKPLVVHIHSTEFDRSGENVNQMIYDIEKKGMYSAAKVIAVSHFTKNIVVNRYGISTDKVEVVYNGVDHDVNGAWSLEKTGIQKNEKIVLFLGRITMQKGPEYFIQAAKRVLAVMDNVKFVMAGSGDMVYQAVEMAAELGIGHKVLFTGFLRGEDVKRIYQLADLYVMPSVSEPFGIAPLEALDHDVPVIISKQSGVSEVLMHALKVDFWDVDEIANKIIAVLKYPPLEITLRNFGNYEVRKLRWTEAAARCLKVYEQTLVSV